MSNFLIFKAAFNNSATPAIGTYTAEGATAQFNRNTDISPDYYLYGNTSGSAIRWFVPTKETTDFEFVADILTTISSGYFTYFIIADSTGTTRLRMWSLNYLVYFENDDSTAQTGTQYIGRFYDTDIGGFEVFHQFRFRVHKLTESSSSVEVYVDGTLKLTATARAALVTCAKIGFMGGVRDTKPLGTRTGIQNTYLYDLSDGDVVNPGVLSGAFNRFISWMKSKFALKSDIPTVNNGTLTIQQNGTNVATFTANQSTNATANITVPTKTSDLTNDSGFITSDNTKIPLAGSNQISGSLIPATDSGINIGSSTKNIKALYTKGITIGGSDGVVIAGSYLARTVNTDVLSLWGGARWDDGVALTLSGKNRENEPSTFRIRLTKDSQNETMFMYLDGTWTWTGTAVQIISDQRLKQQIAEIDDKLLDAWQDVNLVQFKYNDAVDAKKDKARLHTGYVVQQIDSACKSHNVDISAYGLYCHEEYPQETEEVEAEQKDGTKTKETKVIREASEHYSLRYTEVYAVECMYLRRCIARLTARIEELEKGKEQEAGK